MKLLNVKRGQFVYYNNQLHKVYTVKPFFKQSIHLVRLEDLEQQLATAKEIDLYKPQHLDSFVCNYKRYTLRKDVKAKVGDYILVINPMPDSLDHHHLHAIEMVSSIEKNGVISNKENGIKHNEYWVMVPGLEDGATKIDLQKADSKHIHEHVPNVVAERMQVEKNGSQAKGMPRIGDVYQKNDSDPIIQAMVVAIEGRTVYLGANMKVPVEELSNREAWSFVLNILEQ
ncbi:hypothetical protein ACLIBH_05625 [Virgibacillus sp. W0430]|uniref:hypothetical protein n=1 Tax=Virgibacillus sp. W0430 TaxID=3391580 RepID=UPI003F457065